MVSPPNLTWVFNMPRAMRISNFINLWEKYEQAGDDGLPIVLKESQMEQWQIYRTR
jgi:hypothetical protein